MNWQRENPLSTLDGRGKGLLVGMEQADFMDFGLGDYARILQLQDTLRRARQSEAIHDTWLFGEHPTVITQGVRGKVEDIPGIALPDFRFPIVQVDRGGMTTLHCPGQLILYPIVKLTGGSLAAGRMARALLESMRSWLQERHGVQTQIPKGRPGLFFEGRKLLSVGISVRQAVSIHGIAMNLSNDLGLWNHIVSCGEPTTRPVSLSELLGREITPASQRDSIRRWLESDWGYTRVIDRSVPPGSPAGG